jgi:hypothetical protein
MNKIYCLSLLFLLITACSQKDPLDGPIPECVELLSQEKKAYVDQATERCDQARTMDEKLKSVGCTIREKLSACQRERAFRGRSVFD